MKSMGVSRQMTGVVVAFALVALGAVAGLTWQSRRVAKSSDELAARISRVNQTLFGLVSASADVQMIAQKLVRERDPDTIEGLLEQERAARAAADARIAGAGAAGVETAYRNLERVNARVVEALLRGENASAQQLLIEESNPAFDALIEAIVGAQEEFARDSGAQMERVAGESAAAQRFILTVVLLGIGVLTGLAGVVVRRVRRSLGRASEELSRSAEQMNGAALQVSDASRVLAEGATEQAASLEETSASTEEITAITRKSADDSRSAAKLMEEAARVVADANGKLELMVASMNDIRGSGEKISKIIRVIEEIAFQTNILALNAAVEAARAGESGMGFAVVADEVRNLAQRCAQAARDTTSLIEESITKSAEGASRVDTVVQSVRCLVEGTRTARALVDDVSRASGEQARGVDAIAKAVVQMEGVTQRTAATAEQSAAASEQLLAQSESLRGIVGDLDTLVRGTH